MNTACLTSAKRRRKLENGIIAHAWQHKKGQPREELAFSKTHNEERISQPRLPLPHPQRVRSHEHADHA